jgi:rhamnulokinase
VGAPVISARARDLNFTNEGGVGGTIRLLKNIAGLWLLQACMRCWAEAGHAVSYDDLLVAAGDDRLAFRSVFDPDHSSFFNPADMPAAIAAYCRQTDQPEPAGPADYARAILESLALKYRVVLDSLEQLTGRRHTHLRIVGGGSRNRLLNQFTADATGRTVLAGPVEATALGNIAMQMVATGTVRSLADARGIIDQSFPVERFEPVATDRWTAHYNRFQEHREVMGV